VLILPLASGERNGLIVPAASEVQATDRQAPPRLFLLDGCSLRTDLGRLAVRCRALAPGAKVLALLPPGDNVSTEKTRLFCWGLDGFVELHETWQEELPRAIHSILKGQLWVPPEVMLAFVKQAKTLLDSQLLHGHFLTAREAQILQLSDAPFDQQRDFRRACDFRAHRQISRFQYSQQTQRRRPARIIA
jgi:DNA-binding NarL/FixJ family response regulator